MSNFPTSDDPYSQAQSSQQYGHRPPGQPYPGNAQQSQTSYGQSQYPPYPSGYGQPQYPPGYRPQPQYPPGYGPTPYPPGAYPQPGYAYLVPPDPKSGVATAGFVLGLLSVILMFIPEVDIVCIPLCILGIIFSIQGRKSYTKHGLATAGLILSIISGVLSILIIGLVCTLFSGFLFHI